MSPRTPTRSKRNEPSPNAKTATSAASAAGISGFFTQGQSVLVGLSGGPDSVTLLALLAEMAETKGLYVGACYVNHLLRPEEAAREAKFCEDLCDDLSIPFVYVEIDVGAIAKREKISVELAGREARHGALAQIAREDDYDLVALGHNADDQVETILFRLFRGTGPEGIAGIHLRRGVVIRPLLGWTRVQILDYLKTKGLSYCEDSSNVNVEYARNYIRHTVLPAIEMRFPQARRAILRLSEIEEPEREFLDLHARRATARMVARAPSGAVCVDSARFALEAVWLKRAIVRALLREVAGAEATLDFETGRKSRWCRLVRSIRR